MAQSKAAFLEPRSAAAAQIPIPPRGEP